MYLWISLFSLFIRLFLLFSSVLLRVIANVCKARVEPVYEAKIFSTFLMLPLKNPLRNLDGFCLLVCLFLLATVKRDFPWILYLPGIYYPTLKIIGQKSQRSVFKFVKYQWNVSHDSLIHACSLSASWFAK